MSKLASILIFALVSSVIACDEKNHTVCDNKYNTTVPIIPTSTVNRDITILLPTSTDICTSTVTSTVRGRNCYKTKWKTK